MYLRYSPCEVKIQYPLTKPCGTKQFYDPPTQHATSEHDLILGTHVQWLCLYYYDLE